MNPPWINTKAQKLIRYRDDDIVISVPPKSGTTWTMNIVYQLINGGDSDFLDIYNKVPWIEFAETPKTTTQDIVQRINDMPLDVRRAFKTHASPEILPFNPNVKYVVIFRNPEEAIVSFKPFIENHTDEWFAKWGIPHKVMKRETFTQFYNDVIVGLNLWKKFFGFLKNWGPKRNEPNVLFMHFN